MVKLLSMFLLALVPLFLTDSYNLIIDLLNYLLSALAPAIVQVIGLFPSNPCGSLIASCSNVASSLPAPDPGLLLLCLQAVCWILPMQFLANLVGCIMLTVMIFFSMSPLARLFKLIN